MALYTKHTWTDGSGTSMSAANLNQAEQGILDAQTPPSVRAYHSVDQTITDSTWTVLAFDSELLDSNTMHDTVTNNSRLTIQTSGYYLIHAAVGWASSTANRRKLRFRKNGATILAEVDYPSHGIAEVSTSPVLSDLLAFNAADYIELQVWQDSGGSLAAKGGAYQSRIAAALQRFT